jgi:phosphatidylglycerophosphatase C
MNTGTDESNVRTVAAFDFDGTLAFGDAVLPFTRFAAGNMRSGLAVVAAAPALVASLVERSARDSAKAMLSKICFKGMPSSEMERLGKDFAAERMASLNPEMVDRLHWHKEEGHEVVLVSASFEPYMTPLGESLGAEAVLATQLEVVGGTYTGRLDGANVRGEEKANRLRSYLNTGHSSSQPIIWAYGNSSDDHAMLAMADHAFMVDKAGMAKRWG